MVGCGVVIVRMVWCGVGGDSGDGVVWVVIVGVWCGVGGDSGDGVMWCGW